ncbi:MAG TPA: lytic transglycosylase domain-containing protein [Roseateles sp.]|uniref:lytic transglycosylase domain-containing protein n=1 Tax=Roseateles sp. TaxID=1971397 RepID=UPI002ED97BE3
MDASAFLGLVATCAPAVHVDTARALVQVESAFNPWALGVVGGRLLRQPKTRAEAIVTARALRAAGWNFSLGLGQINVRNLARLGLSLESALDPCRNLQAMQSVLSKCFDQARAIAPHSPSQQVLRRALSCYYSGNFDTGFRHGYVGKVVVAARSGTSPSTVFTQEKS